MDDMYFQPLPAVPFCSTCGYPCGRMELEELKVKVSELNDELLKLRGILTSNPMEKRDAPF